MYQRGKIYTIRSHQTNKVYVGSTVNLLCKRMDQHRAKYRQYLNGTHHFVSSFTMLKYEDAYIELHVNYPSDSKEELHRREGEVIREFGESCINMVIPGRTKKEYYEDNKEKLKEYVEKNKEKIKDRMKKYREENRDKLKEDWQIYHENNKDKLNEKKKKFREDNKVRLKEERIEKVECTCGVVITKGCLSRHKKTQKHQDFEKNKIK